jgi:hypothetical protein
VLARCQSDVVVGEDFLVQAFPDMDV